MKSSEKNFLIHSLLILIVISLSFFLVRIEVFADFKLQITSLVIALYLLFQFLVKKGIVKLEGQKETIDLLAISFVIFFLIFSTGGLNSPLFFLVYFLLFGISLLLEPGTAASTTLFAFLFFLLGPKQDFWTEILQLSSLFLIAPLALIFGKQYFRLLSKEKEVKDQETKVYQWTFGSFRKKLYEIQKEVKKLGEDKSIPEKSREKLKKTSEDIFKLYQSGKKMEKEVES